MKQNTFTVIDKYWITGVLPVFRDGISPLTATDIISNKPGFNGLCGLTDTEVRDIAEAYLSRVDQKPEISKVVEHLKRWYNGYLFYQPERGSQVGTLYNPKLVFKYLRGLANKEIRLAPLEEINALHTSNVLASLPDTGEASYLESYLRMISGMLHVKVAYEFGAAEVGKRNKNASIAWSLLYFFGVLTNSGDGSYLRVPNVTMTNVITHRFSEFLDRESQLRDKSNNSYKSLMNRDVGPLVRLLEDFFGEQPARAIKVCGEPALQMTLAAFWSNSVGDCLTELSLLVKPLAPQGKGRSGYLDIFLPTPSSTPCIELKNIPIEALWKGQNGPAPLTSDVPLERLRGELRKETEEQLLERKIDYGNEHKFVKDIKTEAFEQITRYLSLMKGGMAIHNHPGIHDIRLQQVEGNCELMGYVVILLGGTRALGWHVATEKTNFMWHIKDAAREEPLIS